MGNPVGCEVTTDGWTSFRRGMFPITISLEAVLLLQRV